MAPGDEQGWIDRVRGLLDEGRCFVAFDTVRAGREQYPGSLPLVLLGAIALLRVGAPAEARRFLVPVDRELLTAGMDQRRLEALLVDAIAAIRSADPADPAAKAAVAALAEQLRGGARRTLLGRDDLTTLRLAVDVYRELWGRLGDEDDLRRARELAVEAFRAGDLVDGAAAASLSWLADDREAARAIAAAALAAAPSRPDLAQRAAIAAAHLLLGDGPAASDAFAAAAAAARGQPDRVVEMLRRVRRLAARGLPVPEPVFRALRPPAIVLCGGAPIDPPGAPAPLFPPAIEGAVRAAIDAELAALDAAIGYSGAQPGAELLFVEAMLERGAAVNIVLPFQLDDVIRTQVRPAGASWERRFRNALKLADNVDYATDDRFLGHRALLRLAHRMIEGLARIRGEELETEPHLVLVWDYAASGCAGSAADFMDHWPDLRRLRLIDLDRLRGAAGPLAVAAPIATPEPEPGPEPNPEPRADASPGPGERRLHAFLFADIAGYGRLRDEHMPGYLAFLDQVARHLEGLAVRQVDTWGDAVFAVTDTACGAAEYAFRLLEAFAAVDAVALGLPGPLQLRIGLHAGPAYAAANPLNRRATVIGGHVTRAARIEPVARPGLAYASRQFVALLAAEESAARHEAALTGGAYARCYACEYVGLLPLAKGYGTEPVYQVRRAPAHGPVQDASASAAAPDPG